MPDQVEVTLRQLFALEWLEEDDRPNPAAVAILQAAVQKARADALEGPWQRIDEVPPPEGPADNCYFLVWGPHLPSGMAVPYEASRFHDARHESYPAHLSSRGFTHWRWITTPDTEREVSREG